MMNTIKIHPMSLVMALFLATPLYAAELAAEEEPAVDELATLEDEVDKDAKDDNRSPTGCHDTGYQFNLKTLRLLPSKTSNTQSMYFIKNISGQGINLFQMRDAESSRSMYLNHAIPAYYWGILATSEPVINYICTVSKPGASYGEVVDCSQNVKVCEFVNVKFGLNNAGNFWFANSSSRNGAVRIVVHYGIIPDYRKKEPKEKKEKHKKLTKK